MQRVLYEDILPKIEEVVGKDSILPQTVKLTTVDNQDIYKDVSGRIRLLTFDEARKYNQLIVNEELDDYWWLMTPWTSNDRLDYPVAVVSPSGSICFRYYFDCQNSVRPVLYLKSNIFVSLGGKIDEK